MVKKIIKVTSTSQPESWSEFISQNRFSSKNVTPEVLVIDVSSFYFIQPFQVVSLACLIEEYHLKGVEIKFIKGSNQASYYLHRVRFFEYWNKGFDRTNYTKTSVATNLYLWKIHKNRIDSYTNYAKEYYQNNHFQNKDLTPIYISLAEIYNNIFDHSQSKVDGYSYVQYYPKKHEIKLAICDLGIGIPKHINNYLKSQGDAIVEEVNAMEKAFEKRYSSFSEPHNKGLGLDNLSGNVEALHGEMFFLSNSVIMKQKVKKKRFTEIEKDNFNFKGTLVQITLNTKKLSKLEREYSNEEFYL